MMGSALGSCPVPQFSHLRNACARVRKHQPVCPVGQWVAHRVTHQPHHHPPALLPPRLKPFTSYKFRVKATNDIGDSEYSEESESLTTLQAGQRRLLGQGEGLSPARASSSAQGIPKGISRASPPPSLLQPLKKPPPSSPSPPTPPRQCSSAGRYCPLCLLGCHRTSHPPPWEVAPWGARELWLSSPSLCSARSPQPRTRSTGSCWASASATASWCTTPCAASPCAASATPAPRGPSSPVSARGPPSTWGRVVGRDHGDGVGQHPVLHSQGPAWNCQGQTVPRGAVTWPLLPAGPWSLTCPSAMSLLSPAALSRLVPVVWVSGCLHPAWVSV